MTAQVEPQEGILRMTVTVPSRLTTAQMVEENRVIPWMIVDRIKGTGDCTSGARETHPLDDCRLYRVDCIW